MPLSTSAMSSAVPCMVLLFLLICFLFLLLSASRSVGVGDGGEVYLGHLEALLSDSEEELDDGDEFPEIRDEIEANAA